MQFLYRDGSDYVFMDTSSYEQLQVNTDLLGDSADYLKEGDDAVLQFFGTEIVGVDLPASVELTVATPNRDCRGPGVRCPQTGHVGDGSGSAGAPVREPGREDQGRYPDRGVPHPGLKPSSLRLPSGTHLRVADVRCTLGPIPSVKSYRQVMDSHPATKPANGH